MIDIGSLLDACGISYTDKQLTKLDKLLHEILKKLSLQQFDANETTQHGSIPDSEDRFRNEDFASETELKPFQHYIQKFDFESEPHYNHIIKEEIVEESSIEIKEELPNDPFASLETINNSNDISDMVHEKDIESNNSSFPIIENVLHKSEKTSKKRPSLSLSVSLHCPMCMFETSRKNCLDAHIKSHINLDNRESSKNILITTFECYICEKKFPRNYDLKRHEDSVHKKKKLHQCPICHKTFSQECEIKQHTDSIHEKQKPHKCPICDKSFARKYELKTHTEIVHEKKKPYMCTFCDFKCSKKGNLKQHMWIKHDEVYSK